MRDLLHKSLLNPGGSFLSKFYIIYVVVESILNLVDVSLKVIIVLLVLAGLGTFADFAKRSGVFIRSRAKFLMSAAAFTLASLAAVLGVIHLAADENLLLRPIATLNRLWQLGLWSFAAVVVAAYAAALVAGGLGIFAVNLGEVRLLSALLLSARLTLWPLIDLFWAHVYMFIFTIMFAPLLVLSVLAWLWVPSVPPATFLALALLASAILIFALGPSEFLGSLLSLIGFLALLAAVLIFSIVLLLALYVVGILLAPFLLPLAAAMLIVGVAFYVLGRLIAGLGIVRALGLAVIILGILFIASTSWLSDIIAFLESLGLSLQEAAQAIHGVLQALGCGGIVLGILLLIIGKKEEVGQLHTASMALATGILALLLIVMPWLLTSSLIPLSPGRALDTVLSAVLSILLTTQVPLLAPIAYMLATLALRFALAIKWLIIPPRPTG